MQQRELAHTRDIRFPWRQACDGDPKPAGLRLGWEVIPERPVGVALQVLRLQLLSLSVEVQRIPGSDLTGCFSSLAGGQEAEPGVLSGRQGAALVALPLQSQAGLGCGGGGSVRSRKWRLHLAGSIPVDTYRAYKGFVGSNFSHWSCAVAS